MFEYLLSWSHFDCCCVVQYCLEVSCCLVWYVMICTVVQYNSNVQSTDYTLSYTWVGWSNQIRWRELFIFIMCYWIRFFCILHSFLDWSRLSVNRFYPDFRWMAPQNFENLYKILSLDVILCAVAWQNFVDLNSRASKNIVSLYVL